MIQNPQQQRLHAPELLASHPAEMETDWSRSRPRDIAPASGTQAAGGKCVEPENGASITPSHLTNSQQNLL